MPLLRGEIPLLRGELVKTLLNHGGAGVEGKKREEHHGMECKQRVRKEEHRKEEKCGVDIPPAHPLLVLFNPNRKNKSVCLFCCLYNIKLVKSDAKPKLMHVTLTTLK